MGSRVLKMTAYETTDDEGMNYLFTLAYCNLSTATDNVGSELIHIHRFRGERESQGTTNIDPFPFGTRTKIMDDMLAIECEGDCTEAIFLLT
jgi:hypothetical protein